MSRAELKAERDVMKTIYDRTVDRVRQGDYVDDMLKGGVMNGLARTWKDPRRFLTAVHKGLWAHHNKLDHNVCKSILVAVVLSFCAGRQRTGAIDPR